MALKDYLGPILLHENRYYLGAKLHRKLFIFNSLAFFILALFLIVIAGSGWKEVAVIMAVYGLVIATQYFLFDKLSDKIMYRLYGERVEMKHNIDDETYRAIKDLEQNPHLVKDEKTHKRLQK